MQQQQLFEDDRYQAPARRTDPATSHEAAAATRPKLGPAAAAIYDVFAAAPQPYTAVEASLRAAERHGKRPETYRKRAGELQRAGLIRAAGHRLCSITLTKATTFEVTE